MQIVGRPGGSIGFSMHLRRAGLSRGNAMTDMQTTSTDQQLYRVTDVMRMLSMSRSVIYEQLRSGRLRSVRQGRSRRIPAAAVAEYVALLEREAEQ